MQYERARREGPLEGESWDDTKEYMFLIDKNDRFYMLNFVSCSIINFANSANLW